MDGRMRRYGGSASPDRSRAWSEPPPSPPPPQQQAKVMKIPVVYYLCRNRHLEHPHFIEVPLSSHDGLYLRDVINRLNVLRGKGMPAMYSWSCKRSYKNGFVWHDLSEDDLILPAHGNEYVLKGSELLDQSPPDRTNHGATNPKPQTPKPPQQETSNSSRTHQASSSSSPNIVIKEAKNPPSPSHYPNPSRPGSSSDISPETGRPRLWESSSPGPEENNNVYQPNRAANASTQTDNRGGRTARGPKHSCTRGVSTEEFGSRDPEFNHTHPTRASRSVSGGDGISPPLTSSSVSSSGCGKTETLESLIRAEASKMNSFRILEEEEVFVPSITSKVKATNVLMQLITCGSISVKDHHSFGLIPNYRPRFSQVNFPSTMFGSSMWIRDLDCLSENPRMLGLRLEDKEYFSGSYIETKKYKEESGRGAPTLKRSSSYNADRSCSPDSKRERENVADSSRSKCLPRTIKITSNKQPTSARSPISEYPRNSSDCLDDGQSSRGGSKRFTDTAVRGSSTRFEPYKEEKDKVFKIEERLTSGARVIIQSRAPCDDSEGSPSY